MRNVGMLRLKAIKLHEAAASPLSPAVQEAQMSFLATPSHSPRTQADDRAALRLQSVFRGNRVRRQLLAERRAATKIQARFRGQRGRIIAMSIASMTKLHLGQVCLCKAPPVFKLSVPQLIRFPRLLGWLQNEMTQNRNVKRHCAWDCCRTVAFPGKGVNESQLFSFRESMRKHRHDRYFYNRQL